MTLLLLLALLLSPAQAAPPVGADPNSAAATWFKSLRTPKGYSCCDESDCRPTGVELRQDGVWAWIGRDVYGDDAPDEWRQIPAALLKQMHPPRPPGVRMMRWPCSTTSARISPVSASRATVPPTAAMAASVRAMISGCMARRRLLSAMRS